MTARTRRIETGSYELLILDVPIGRADKTGTHLDDYPWSWHIYDDVTIDSEARRVGQTATKREAIDSMLYHYLGHDAYWSEGSLR